MLPGRCNRRFHVVARESEGIAGAAERSWIASSLALLAITRISLFLSRHPRRTAAGRGGVDGHRLLGRKSRQIMRSAGLGTGARQAMAAERLQADPRADHVAVDIDGA